MPFELDEGYIKELESKYGRKWMDNPLGEGMGAIYLLDQLNDHVLFIRRKLEEPKIHPQSVIKDITDRTALVNEINSALSEHKVGYHWHN